LKNDRTDSALSQREQTRKADYKGLGGKLVRVKIVEDSGIIRQAQITGDFFLLPEESLTRLEQALTGTKITEAALKKVVDDFFTETKAQGLGVSREDFVKAVISARELD
jgi:Bacterial lipoate protein ligase C-terminus